MVNVLCSFTVIPSETTPNATLWLSANDQIHPLTQSTVYFYKSESHHKFIPDAIERMRNSLSKLLVPYYPLAGRIRRISGGRLEVDCNAKGVTLLEVESTKGLKDFGDFKPDETLTGLVPTVDYTKPIEELPLLLVQLTRFSCGGISIGVAFSHVIADGVSAIHFINSWAKLCRGETLNDDEKPFLDRTIYKSPEPLMAPRFEHREFQPLPLISDCSDSVDEKKKKTEVALLKLSKEQVQKLRKIVSEAVNEEKNEGKLRPYTRYESIAAHIWKSACNARKHDFHQPTAVVIGSSSRDRLIPPLPQNFFGNAVLPTITPRCLSGEIISKPLSFAAQNIREAIEILTDEYIRSQLDFLESQEQVWLRPAFHTLGYKQAPFVGNPNLSIWYWARLPVHEADFGWGKPIHMGPASLDTDGDLIILPGSSGDGSLAVAIRLQKDRMEDFKKFFYENI